MSVKILIVDDEAQIERLFRQRLRREIRKGNYELRFARNGLEALTQIEEIQDFDIILCDINMPIMNGFDFLTRLVEQPIFSKVVMVSAYGNIKNIRQAMNLGAYDFIVKPIDFEDLHITIQKALKEIAQFKAIAETKKQLTETHKALAVSEAQAQKLREIDQLKSRFFANISHEFRTPLTIIGGMVAQIRKEPKRWLEKGLELIQRNNHQLLDLVNQILDLRKLESGTMNLDMIQGDIVFYLRYIMESFHSLAERKGIALHFLSEFEQLQMDFDREKMLRVISNIMSNAIKFTPQEGNVYMLLSIQQWEESSENTIIPNDQLSKDCLFLIIKDTGSGIPPEKLPYIFDRFYQVDDSNTRQGEGTGIGLALTKELVKLMGGDITAISEINKGSIFKLRLPINQNAPIETSNNPVDTPLIPSSSSLEIVPTKALDLAHKLLIIEDNSDIVTYLESILAGHYHIIIARDGNEGIKKAIEEVPDLIISDIMMPYKNGFEVCRILKQDQITSHIPIVLLTAKVEIDSRLDGLRRGADAYLN